MAGSFSSENLYMPDCKRPKLASCLSNGLDDHGDRGIKYSPSFSPSANIVSGHRDSPDQIITSRIPASVAAVNCNDAVKSPSLVLSTSSSSTDESGYQSSGGVSATTPQQATPQTTYSNQGYLNSSPINTGVPPASSYAPSSAMSGFHNSAAQFNFTSSTSMPSTPHNGNPYNQATKTSMQSVTLQPVTPGGGTGHSRMMDGSNHYPSPGAAGGGGGGPPSVSSVAASSMSKEVILKCQQLIFYFCHSSGCLFKSNTNGQMCRVPLCAESRQILRHLNEGRCPDVRHESRLCSLPSCSGIRWARDHYTSCKNMNCVYCEPVRKNKAAFGSSPQNTLHQPIAQFRNFLKEIIMADEPATAKPDADRKGAFELNKKMRLSCICNMVNTIIPEKQDGEGMVMAAEEQARQLIHLTRQVEVDVYYTAKSKEDYYELLAKKSYEFKKRMEELHRKQDKTLPGGGGGGGGAGNGPQPESPGDTASLENKNKWLTSLLNKETSPIVKSPSISRDHSTSDDLTPKIKSEPEEPIPSIKSEPSSCENNNSVKTPVSNKTQSPATPAPETSSTTPQTPSSSSSLSSSSTNAGKPSDTLAKKPKSVKKFSVDEMRQFLWPCLQHIIGLPESEPFRTPVDYVQMGIPDYPLVVKQPMDISTIRKNMFEGKYNNPWQFIDHMHLMFSNAWLYNKKNTKVYKITTRLSEIFYEKIDEAMHSMGYCCGQTYSFSPIPVYCYQKLCHIPRDAKYYQWTNTGPKTGIISEKYIYCTKCFNDTGDETFPVSDEPGVPGVPVFPVNKSAFEEVTNNIVEFEKFTDCMECGRAWHTICAMHHPSIWKEFVCPNCLKGQGRLLSDNRFIASRLPTNKMASFIERNVNKHLKAHDCPHVSIRVLSSSNKIAEVQPKMRAKFPDFPKQFPYRHKALFAFTQVDGRDVCIFGMTVQEYNSECPQPNTRRVYLSYLDSVFYFQPKQMRTALYHRILLAYLEYCRGLGYEFAHIWACPPGEGDDYIFHCHPPEQKTPKPKRLQDWYKKMLDLAVEEKAVVEYKDIQKACEDVPNFNFTHLPYFEGDYWPKVLEDLISQCCGDPQALPGSGQNSKPSGSSTGPDTPAAASTPGGSEEKPSQSNRCREEDANNESDPALTPGAPEDTESQQQGATTTNGPVVEKPRKKTKKAKNSKRKPTSTMDLSDRVSQNITQCRESFFTIRLRDDVETLGKIEDPDPDVHFDLMEGRDSFLHMSREKYWEFSSFRRARYSSMCMLYELHSQVPQKANHCAECKQVVNVTTGFHCETCIDYHVCVKCKEKVTHEHELVKYKAEEVEIKEAGKRNNSEKINQLVKVLVHATTCRNANCNTPQCSTFKKWLSHMNSCQNKARSNSTGGQQSKDNKSGCTQCTNLFRIFLKHSETCTNTPCTVPHCQDIRKRKSRQEDLLVRRRMKQMQTGANRNPSGQNSTPENSTRSPINPPSVGANPSTPGSATYNNYCSPSPVAVAVEPNNPPPGALEAAQRAKKFAAMQSSAAAAGSYGYPAAAAAHMVGATGPGPVGYTPGGPPATPLDSMTGMLNSGPGPGAPSAGMYDSFNAPIRAPWGSQFYQGQRPMDPNMPMASQTQLRNSLIRSPHVSSAMGYNMMPKNPEMMSKMMQHRAQQMASATGMWSMNPRMMGPAAAPGGQMRAASGASYIMMSSSGPGQVPPGMGGPGAGAGTGPGVAFSDQHQMQSQQFYQDASGASHTGTSQLGPHSQSFDPNGGSFPIQTASQTPGGAQMTPVPQGVIPGGGGGGGGYFQSQPMMPGGNPATVAAQSGQIYQMRAGVSAPMMPGQHQQAQMPPNSQAALMGGGGVVNSNNCNTGDDLQRYAESL